MRQEFFEAIKRGDQQQVEQMLNEDSNLLRASSDRKTSPILTSVYYQQSEITKFLVSRTIILNIFEAAATGALTHVIRLLARAPEQVNAFSPDGFQPLGLACYFGHLEVAEYLIKAGAEINTQSKNTLQSSSLHSAADGGYTAIVRLLLDHGADPNSRQSGGYTSLHNAARKGYTAILRLLIFNGANLKTKSSDGKTALDLARQSNQAEAIELLQSEITRRFRNPFFNR